MNELKPMSKTVRGFEVFAVIVSIIGWSICGYYMYEAQIQGQYCSDHLHGWDLTNCNNQILDKDQRSMLGFGLRLPFSVMSIIIHVRYFE